MGALHRSQYIAALACTWHHRLIKRHGDIWPKRFLDLNRTLWREEVLTPIKMAVESRPLFTDAHQRTERNYLKAARIRQHRLTPRRKPVEAAEPLDPLMSRSQVEVICVRQDDLRADAMQIIWVKRLHGGIGTDRHEVGRFNDAVRQRERASTSV